VNFTELMEDIFTPISIDLVVGHGCSLSYLTTWCSNQFTPNDVSRYHLAFWQSQ